MISTPLMSSKILGHTRSVSLPNNRSHPLIPQFNEHLQRLKPCDSTTSSSSSFLSITKNLKNLDNLYNSVDDLLLLPHTRQVFAQECHEKWVQETLDGYLGLVDACAMAKDFVIQSKQEVQDLLSVLRRRREAEDLHKFLDSRKRAKKMINKSLRNMSCFKNKPTMIALEKNQETIAIISMLKEAESVTLDAITVLLSSISGTRSNSRTSGWSLVSKLIQLRKNSGNNNNAPPEFEELDSTVCKLVGLGTSKSVEIEELQIKLKEVESSIQGVEDELENLFKRLIRARVSLLNMQSQ